MQLRGAEQQLWGAGQQLWGRGQLRGVESESDAADRTLQLRRIEFEKRRMRKELKKRKRKLRQFGIRDEALRDARSLEFRDPGSVDGTEKQRNWAGDETTHLRQPKYYWTMLFKDEILLFFFLIIGTYFSFFVTTSC